METNYNKKENKVIKYVRTRKHYKREKNVMRDYLSNYPQNSIHNCLEKRKRWFQAGEIRLRMVKEETSEQMDIFIQHKAVFISIYLEMQLFLFLIHSLIIYWAASTCPVSATHSMLCLYPWWVYNPEKAKERSRYWPLCKTQCKGGVFKCCEWGAANSAKDRKQRRNSQGTQLSPLCKISILSCFQIWLPQRAAGK